MPPRIRNAKRLSHNPRTHMSPSSSSSSPTASLLPSSLSQSSLTPLSYCSKPSPQLARPFSSSPIPPTKLRRDMFSWLNGPGAAFKQPLPGSTNYLSAYDRRGKLLRVQETQDAATSENSRAPDRQPDEEQDKAAEGDAVVPRESRQDLRPFPLNPAFVSQSVLSGELRNAIYEHVVVRGKSVRAVSVLFGVDMRRVGAVVRLVELEKRWIKEVCHISGSLFSSHFWFCPQYHARINVLALPSCPCINDETAI